MAKVVPASDLVQVSLYDPTFNKSKGYPNNFISTSKYTVLTFLPMNLYEQFRRISNQYFLVNMIFALIPGIAPVSPLTAVLPLLFVLGVAAIKDGYEDYVRHQCDNRANSILAQVVRDGQMVKVQSRDIEAGDIIRIEQGEEVRADVLILSSCLPEGAAYMDTCNLDGETNIKNRRAKECTWHLSTVAMLAKPGLIKLQCDPPNAKLSGWKGILTLEGTDHAVGEDQFLFRSAVLRNTEYIYGMVVYSGTDTKMAQNLKQKPPKMSNLDLKLNKLIGLLLLVQNALLFTICGTAVGWYKGTGYAMWFLGSQRNKDDNGAATFFLRYLTYFILMSYLIPISLFVTIELCKVAQAKFMEWDIGMSGVVGGKLCYCKANTSNLNEQLSQVKYIFTDKTGTLTENVMNFAQGQILDYFHDELSSPGNLLKILNGTLDGTAPSENLQKNVDEYVKALALCHTVQPFVDKSNPGKFVYEGQSPDEAALVGTAAKSGYELIARSTKTLTIRAKECTNIEYEIMATLEFTADRKMMSIVLRDPIRRCIFIITKGADSSVMPRLCKDPHNERVLQTTKDSLIRSANLGLRTLVMGTRIIAEDEFQTWFAKFEEAGKAMTNRTQVVDAACLLLERDFLLVGCTAIEDKLQDKVPQTLRFLLDAGIIVWMLTGDKRETAVTIARTSQLCDPETDQLCHIDVSETMDVAACKTQLEDALEKSKDKSKKTTIIIDGITVGIATKHNPEIFLDLSQRVSAAVCCRLTPLQKANIVEMFQNSSGATALAIGDGANDVPMIQAGRVGIGIIGMEGAQAALAADYAIPRFKHLRRLLAVHGRYSLYRNAFCIGFSFYKNITLALLQFYFSFFTGSSGQTMMEGWLLAFFNFAFTSIPPLFIGIFEKDVLDEQAESFPELYPPLREGQYFDTKALGAWFFQAWFHATVLFFFTHLSRVDDDNFTPNGGITENISSSDWMLQGTLVMFCLVFLVLTKASLHMKTWTWLLFGALLFSYVAFVGFCLLYSLIFDPKFFSEPPNFYWTTYNLFSSSKSYLYLLFFTFGLLTVEVAVLFYSKEYSPSAVDRIQKRGLVTGDTKGLNLEISNNRIVLVFGS